MCEGVRRGVCEEVVCWNVVCVRERWCEGGEEGEEEGEEEGCDVVWCMEDGRV